MKSDEPKWWQVRWRAAGRIVWRGFLGLLIAAAMLCLIVVKFYGIVGPIKPWLHARALAKMDPRVAVVPVNLPDQTVTLLPAQPRIKLHHLTFLAPGESVPGLPYNKMNTIISLTKGGTMLIELSDKGLSNFAEMVRMSQETGTLLTAEEQQSEVVLADAVLGATPDQVQWWRFGSRANRRADLLLTAKIVYLLQTPLHAPPPAGVFAFYRLASREWTGYQIGDPAQAPYTVRLELFDQTNRHLQINIAGPEEVGALLTQAEINALVASLRSEMEP